jgi:hypothetical protein
MTRHFDNSGRFQPGAKDPGKCQHGPCQCVVEEGEQYCSPYCEEAAAQGLEREYCQCEHESGSEEKKFSKSRKAYVSTV